MQDDLLSSCKSDPNEFWKKIGKVGVGTDRSKNIPMEVKLDNGSVSNDVNDVLKVHGKRNLKSYITSRARKTDQPHRMLLMEGPVNRRSSFTKEYQLWKLRKLFVR